MRKSVKVEEEEVEEEEEEVEKEGGMKVCVSAVQAA